MLLSAITAYPQARTAESVVDVPHSLLNQGNPRNGSIRHDINGTPGTSPCAGGGTGALAIKIAGVWHCPRLTAGVGTGDVGGPTASQVGEMVLFSDMSGKGIGRSNTLSGIPLLTSGVVTVLGSSGTGNVARATGATLTAPTLLTPTIASFNFAQHDHEDADGGNQLNASNVFNGGTIPPARIITGVITNSRCLRVSNVGQIEVAAADCGAGSGGAPGGVSGNLTFNEAGAFGGIGNSAYDSVTGRLTINQKANSNDTLFGQRFTDTSPTGYMLRFRNAAGTLDLFSVGADATVYASSYFTIKAVAAPSTPAAGNSAVWVDSTGKNLQVKDDAGVISNTVRAVTCTGDDKVSGISSAGVVTCSADQITGGGAGITSLNGLTAASQTFADVDDTNVTLAWSPVTSTHTLTVGWTGTLAKARQNAATVYVDQGNTWSTGAQDMGAATSFKVPTSAGAAPTASGLIAFDTTSSTLEYGSNGTNRVVVNTASSQTLSNKILDNTTTYAARDTLFTLQDDGDATKTVNFELGGLTTATNRVVTIANAASVTVQPTTATANQWITHIDSAGLQTKAQPAFSNLSGTLAVTQGSTGQSAVAQGDLLYGDAANSWARLAKNTSATRVLTNTGTSNNPAWAQLNLTNGVTGILPAANILATVTNSRCLRVNSSGVIEVHSADCGAGGGGSGDMILADVQVVTGAKTFDPAKLIVGSQSATPAAVAGAFYRDSDDTKLYWAFNGTTYGEVYVSGVSVLNVASANITGILPLVNGGTNQASWTASRCVQVNSAGTALEAAAAACGSGGGGGTPGGSNTQVQFNDSSAFGGDAGLTYNKTTDTLTIAGAMIVGSSGAGYLELAEGGAPTVVANRLTIAAPADVIASGYVYLLPADTPTNGEQLTANISGTTVTLSWDAAGSGGSATAWDSITDPTGNGDVNFTTTIQTLTATTAITNASTDILAKRHVTSGTPAIGLGVRDVFSVETTGIGSDGTAYPMAAFGGTADQVDHGTRAGRASVYSNTVGSSTLVERAFFNANGFNVNPRTATAGDTGNIRLLELAANGVDYVSQKVADSVTASYTLTWPGAAPSGSTGYSASNYVASITSGGTIAFVKVSPPLTFNSPLTETGGVVDLNTVSLAKGGTGAALTDPNADRILFWDDSAGTMEWLTVGSGLSITGTTLSATGGGGGTVTATGGSLTSNAIVLGAGSLDTKVVAGIITDGTSKLTLGVAGASVGSVDFKNATSGTITLSPVTGALGTVTLSLPARTATVATTTGTLTSGRCVEIDGSGNLIQSAAACNAGQPLDSDLTTIAGLTATTDNFIVSVSSAWASRTVAQVKTTLALNNVDNTSDASKPVSTAQQTALDLKANLASPTFTGTVTIPTPFTLGAVSVLPTGTELNFVDGVTSAIQTQLDAKAPLASPVFTTQITSPKVVWTGAVQDLSGSGTPEAAITAAIGSVYRRTDGGASTTLYVKESGAGNTGWVAYGVGGGSGAPTDATYITLSSNAGLSAERVLSGTANEIVVTDNTTTAVLSLATGIDAAKIGGGGVSTTEFDFLGTVSSNVQTQLNAKAPTASPTFTGTVTIPTPFTLGAVSVLPTGTELNFVDGVTSSIQTQLDGKAPLATPTFTTSITTPVLISGAANPADAGVIRLGNTEIIGWETATPGTDITLTVNSSDVLTSSGTFNASTLQEAGNAVPNSVDHLGFFAATTSTQLLGVINDETGTNKLVFSDNPVLVTPNLGTPSAVVLTNATGTAASLTAGIASVANTGDSATAFFSTGTVEAARLPTASDTASGIVELATIAETNTGTDAARALTPDGLAGSVFGEKNVQLIAFDFTTDTATGDGKFYFIVPASLNGMILVAVRAEVVTAGTTNPTTVDLARCATAATGNLCSGTVVDMLSTNITIDSGENSTDTAAAAVIDTANDDVTTGQVIRVDVDAISTTAAKGLIITITFRLP